MSLIRQLWLGVILIALLALSGSFAISMVSARHYLEDQLLLKNQDNAGSLALLMSQQPYDPVTVELFIAAQFDTGHYSSIRFLSPTGLTIAERHQKAEIDDVPLWFQHLIPLHVPAGKAQVAQGWQQTGSIVVESQSRFAYISLWKSSLNLLIAFGVGTAMTLVLGSMWLNRIRPPLLAVVSQAKAIQERRFVTIKEPKIPELRSVARAMNATVERLQAMFAEDAEHLEALRQEANHDPLTGLINRSCFLAELEQAMHSPEKARQGSVLFLRVLNLAELNRRLGHATVDQILRALSQALKQLSVENEGMIVGRMNGVDFAVLAPGGDVTRLAKTLFECGQAALSAATSVGSGVAVGWALYSYEDTVPHVLANVDHALAKAESQSIHIAGFSAVAALPAPPRSINEWQDLFDKAIQQKSFKLVRFPVLAMDGNLLHHEAVLRLSPSPDVWLLAADFLPMACRLGRSADLDFGVLELALEESSHSGEAYSINIDGASLATPGFIQRVEQRLLQHKQSLSNMWIEVSEISALNHVGAFAEWCSRLAPLGVRLGVDHFGDQLSGVTQLHGLGLAYIKIDGRFIQNLNERSSNQNFVRGLVGMGHAMGTLVIAEGVHEIEERDAIEALGFDGATGPGVR